MPEFDLPPRTETLLEMRSMGIIENIIPLLALAREKAMSIEQLVSWNVERYSDYGFHQAWMDLNGRGNVRAFARDFIRGRRMLYDDIQVESNDDEIIVASRMWYHQQPPSALFFFDVELVEFRQYAAALMEEHARRVDVELRITEVDDREVAHIRSLPVEAQP